MRLVSRKILAVSIICLAGLGIIFSLFLLFQVWNYRQPITKKLQSGVDQFSAILQTTDDGLITVNQAVINVYSSTLYLQDATHVLSQTMGTTSLFMESANSFVGDDLLTTITSTQTALESAQASAKVIDNLLGTLSRIPLIGITYNPSVPLNTALGNVSTSLDPLHYTLKDFQANLESARTNIHEFSGQISTLNDNIVSIQKNITQTQRTIDKYRSQISSLLARLSVAKTNLPRWTSLTAWILTAIIIWLIVIQIALMLQAISTITEPLASQDTIIKRE